jgi:hypothetical protein
MIKLPITIEYNDGKVETYVANPPEWAKWERETGHKITQAESMIGMWDLLFLAYNALKRENAGEKPLKPFDIWMLTVANVMAGEENPKVTTAEA